MLPLRVVSLLVCIAVWFSPVQSLQAEVRVGVSRVDITPPVGGLTRGYSSAKPTDGVHDRLTATAMLIQSEEQCIALVVSDLCAYNSRRLHDQMASLGVDRLLMLSTHTHAGPKLNQDDFPSPEKPWHEEVDRRILDAIRSAKDTTFRANFTAASGNVQLGYNRLVHRGEDHAVTHFENPHRVPYGSVDPTVGVIRVTDDQQRTRAVLVNYACHPVVLGPRNRKLSADYPGVVRERVEQSVDGDCLCLFIQGAAGDINPLMMARGDDRTKDFEVVQAMGEVLATEVLRTLKSIDREPSDEQSVQAASFETEFRNRWNVNERLTLGTTTFLINDNIAILTMPGEPFHRFQLDFRNRAGVEQAFLFGYCCDGPYEWPKYLPDIVSAARGGYGASDTTFAEVGAGERLVNEGLVALFRLQDRLKSQPQRHTFETDESE